MDRQTRKEILARQNERRRRKKQVRPETLWHWNHVPDYGLKEGRADAKTQGAGAESPAE